MGFFDRDMPTSQYGSHSLSGQNFLGNEGRQQYTDQGMRTAHLRDGFRADDSSFRGDQEALIGRLRGQMNGQDSMSSLQLRGATDQNIAQQRSLAASASPSNAAMAQRMAAQNIGQQNQGFGSQAAMLGIQERNAAAGMLGQVAGQGRGQDQQNNQFNASANLQNRQQNDQYALGMGQLGVQNAAGQAGVQAHLNQNMVDMRGQDMSATPGESGYDQLLAGVETGAKFIPKGPGSAEGGIFTKPSTRVVGEAGPEAIVPVEKLPDLIMRMMYGEKAQPSQPTEDYGPPNLNRRDIEDSYEMKQRGTALDRERMERQEPNAMFYGQDDSHSVGHRRDFDAERGVPRFGEGAVVTKPTNAIIGDQGPEAVIPLHKFPGLIQRLKGRMT